MKKFLSILIASLLWCNIGYSNDKINLVCSFQKSVTEIPFATTGDGEIVKNKDELSPSITQDKYIEYEVISEDEGRIIDTSFYIGVEKLSKSLVLNIDDKEMGFVIRYHEEWVDVFILDRYTGTLQRVVQRFEEKKIDYYSCYKKDKI